MTVRPWFVINRANPDPCREGDEGMFEITQRDGQARIGKFHTQHGVIETPALLPVVNPNIRTIEPRKLWDDYGIEAIITNAYVFWKHETLHREATQNGVHAVLDFPGMIMTDSGTFQSYMYGEVEVGIEEIVKFQSTIGVDVGTMLDVFTKPDMSYTEVQAGVHETLARAEKSLFSASGLMLNGPIQGGVYPDLRQLSASSMAQHAFAIHPIGGIVPIMEQHHYSTYAQVMLSSLPFLPPQRPVHMFGCGHPMLFPMSIALGADFFDSAAYAIFARDGRLLTPWGTERLQDLVDWPVIMPSVAKYSPGEVRALSQNEREHLLACYNLEVTLAELARCKQAIRDGTIWQLAEQRSHQHPALREAFLWVQSLSQLNGEHIGIQRHPPSSGGTSPFDWAVSWEWLCSTQTVPKTGGVAWSAEDMFARPAIIEARRRLHLHWSPKKTSSTVLIAYGLKGPFREQLNELAMVVYEHAPHIELMIATPLGLLPYGLEDINPFAHTDPPGWALHQQPPDWWISDELKRLKCSHLSHICVNTTPNGWLDALLQNIELPPQHQFHSRNEHLTAIHTEQGISKVMLYLHLSRQDATSMMHGTTFFVNKQGRLKNISSHDGRHILSPRLYDGGLSLTTEGAKDVFTFRSHPLPTSIPANSCELGGELGPAVVVVDEDAEPYVRSGRSVFHGFILAVDEWLLPDEACLIVNPHGELIGHGISLCSATEFQTLRKGMAIKVRGGISPE